MEKKISIAYNGNNWSFFFVKRNKNGNVFTIEKMETCNYLVYK